jgi:hypothetical protein
MASKVYVTSDDVLLFKQPRAGTEARQLVKEGTKVTSTGEIFTDQLPNGIHRFVQATVEGVSGYILENRLIEQVEKA